MQKKERRRRPFVEKREKRKEEETMHKMSEVAAAVCYICGKEFVKEKYCNRHIRNIHRVNTRGEVVPEAPATQFTCDVCGRQFSQKSTLRRHVSTVHSTVREHSGDKIKCSQCDFQTEYKNSIKRHLRKVHDSDKKVQSKEYFKCSLCSAKYSTLKNLRYHERKRHKIGVLDPIKRNCPLCKYISFERSKEAMYTHFREDHGITISWQMYNFNSMVDFKSWKKRLEEENGAYFLKNFESKQQLVYVCHRSGNFVTRGANIRRLKSIGSCKINGFCPSAIKVNFKNNTVNVLYNPVHIGHETDPKYVRPSCGGLGGGRKYRQAMRTARETKKSDSGKKDLPTGAVLVAVLDENNAIIANEVVVENTDVIQELNNSSVIDSSATNPNSYNEDHDTMLYLEKVKLFQEFREFEGFLQKNVTSLEQINYVRREIVKIVTDISATNSTLNIG